MNNGQQVNQQLVPFCGPIFNVQTRIGVEQKDRKLINNIVALYFAQRYTKPYCATEFQCWCIMINAA